MYSRNGNSFDTRILDWLFWIRWSHALHFHLQHLKCIFAIGKLTVYPFLKVEILIEVKLYGWWKENWTKV